MYNWGLIRNLFSLQDMDYHFVKILIFFFFLHTPFEERNGKVRA
jgi:hypothetical protein